MGSLMNFICIDTSDENYPGNGELQIFNIEWRTEASISVFFNWISFLFFIFLIQNKSQSIVWNDDSLSFSGHLIKVTNKFSYHTYTWNKFACFVCQMYRQHKEMIFLVTEFIFLWHDSTNFFSCVKIWWTFFGCAFVCVTIKKNNLRFSDLAVFHNL